MLANSLKEMQIQTQAYLFLQMDLFIKEDLETLSSMAMGESKIIEKR